MGELGIQATEAGYNAARAAAGPGTLARFGPSALLASGIAATVLDSLMHQKKKKKQKPL